LRKRARAEIQPLERRQLLSAPTSPRASTLAWFDRGERAELLARMTLAPSGTRSTLTAQLGSTSNTNMAGFDNALLSYIQSRTSARFYFDDSQTASLASFMNSNLDVSSVTTPAAAMTDARAFPTITGDTVPLPGNINFRNPGIEGVAEFRDGLNRQAFWQGLAQTFRFTGQSKYLEEVRYQLADWSDEFRTMDLPVEWGADGALSWQFTTALRADNWTWTYFTLVGGSGFTGTDSTLFVHKLMQHADWLYQQSISATVDQTVDSNRTLVMAKSLHQLGAMFPEFDNASLWLSRGRELLFQTARAQIYPDGSHVEQSPGYQLAVIDDLLEARQLDVLNGRTAAWPGDMMPLIEASMESYRQFLTPDARRPGIGDTYRISSVNTFLRAGLISGQVTPQSSIVSGSYDHTATSFNVADASKFSVGDYINASNKSEVLRVSSVNTGTNTLGVLRAQLGTETRGLDNGITLYNLGNRPFAKPRSRDVWLLGADAVTPYLRVPASPVGGLGDRGTGFAMPDSGNFVLRSHTSDVNATQFSFDAGPKGGIHGHYDPLGFELFSGGRPLIIDPGPYQYDNSTDRNYAISTRAHNTINVNGLNTGQLEDPDGTGTSRSLSLGASHTFGSTSFLTGWHMGYHHIAGAPTVARSVWYDHGNPGAGGGTFVLVDWVEASRSLTFQQSFNLPATVDAATTGVQTDSSFRTRYAGGAHNVRVQAINGGSVVRGGVTFVTDVDDTDLKSDAYRFTVSQTGTFVVFVTLIQVYAGTSAPSVTATRIGSAPTPGGNVQVRLARNGTFDRDITFTPPAFERVIGNGMDGIVTDIAYDSSGNLHTVFQSRLGGSLKYAVRDASTSAWSLVQTIDADTNALGSFLDLEIDGAGRPGVAYFDAHNGDLRYAQLNIETNQWEKQIVDSKQSVGLYPSLTFTGSNAAIISYYHRTRGDLRIATQQPTSWTIETFASTGDQGRFSEIKRDPNRPDLNARYQIVWSNTSTARVHYAYLDGTWKHEIVNDPIVDGAAYLSLAFYDTGSGVTGQAGASNWRYMPAISYFESSPDTSLKYAKRDKQGLWSIQRVDGAGTAHRGLYSQLRFNASNREDIFYFDRKSTDIRRATRQSNGSWLYSVVASGGRAMRIDEWGSSLAVIALNGSNISPRILHPTA
jgi:hypothetical protein